MAEHDGYQWKRIAAGFPPRGDGQLFQPARGVRESSNRGTPVLGLTRRIGSLRFWASMMVMGAIVCFGGLYEGLESGTGSALALGGVIWAFSSLGKLKAAQARWENSLD